MTQIQCGITCLLSLTFPQQMAVTDTIVPKGALQQPEACAHARECSSHWTMSRWPLVFCQARHLSA